MQSFLPRRSVGLVAILFFLPLPARISQPLTGQTKSSSGENAPHEDWRNPPAPKKPVIAQASNEGQAAIGGFKVPDGWQVNLFAAEPDVANPVAFDVDYQGRVFVAESFRQERGIEDNRNHRHWLVDDLAAMSIQDRLAYIKRHLKEKAADYTKHDDRIRLLLDTNKDGRADVSQIFSDRYNTILSGSGAGVLSYRDNVYFTCIPDLWRLHDSDKDGVADQRKILSTGYGVRFAFRGHDLHGPIVGPDGRLYFSIGDRGYAIPLGNVLGGDGPNKPFEYREIGIFQRLLADPSSGAVFRCELDGSNLEVIATGLRNPQELAFDDFGNLFTGDNNSDSGDKARWVFVVPGGDSGWRMYYQYLPDRGPFNREKIWHPYHSETPAYIVPPVTNLSDGPAGLAYYPGTGLSDHFKNRFFLCDFRGQSNVSGIRTFRVKPRGAFFEVVDQEQSIWQILPTDIQFGPDGKIYISDWVHGWQGEGKGRIYTFADPKADQQMISQVQSILANGFKKTSLADLENLLRHPDRRVRREAQFELFARNNDQIFFKVAADEKASLLARLHSIWGIEQIMRKKDKAVFEKKGPFFDREHEFRKKVANLIKQIAKSANPEVRAQAMRVIADNDIFENKDVVKTALNDSNRRVVYFAILAIPVFEDSSFAKPLCDIIEQNDNFDPMIRHAAIMAFFKSSENEERTIDSSGTRHQPSLATSNAAKHKSAAVRLVAVAAIRKRALANGNPVLKNAARSALAPDYNELLKDLLNDNDPQVATEAARAIYDTQYLGLLEELAAQIKKPNLPDPLLRRSIAANYRLGQPKNAELLASFAADQNTPLDRRIVAIRHLANWASPPKIDSCIGIYWPVNKHEPEHKHQSEFAITAIEPHFESLLKSQSSVVKELITATQKLQMKHTVSSLAELFENKSAIPEIRSAALLGLAQLKSKNLNELINTASQSDHWRLRVAALQAMAESNHPKTVEYFLKAIKSTVVDERQAAWRIAGQLRDSNSAAQLKNAIEAISTENFDDATSLDVYLAAEKRREPVIQQALTQLKRQLKSAGQNEKTAAFRLVRIGGDARLGRNVFFEKTEVSCLRCHKIGNRGGEVGPNLSKIGTEKDRQYLLEAIVDPNKTIAKDFESVVVLDLQGESHTGIIKNRTDEFVELMDADGKTKKIAIDDIDETNKTISSMPEDVIEKLSLDELRNLIAYLAQLKGNDSGQVQEK